MHYPLPVCTGICRLSGGAEKKTAPSEDVSDGARTEREDFSHMNQTAAKKNKAKTSPTTILLIVLLALAAVILVVSLINNIGIVGRLDKAVKTDNYSLSKNQIQVLEFQQRQNIYQNLYYNCLYYSYGISSNDIFGDLSSYKNKPDQYAQDHLKYYNFDSLAYSSAESLLVYCEGARAAGITLTKEELKDEESLQKVGAINLSSLQSGADSNGQTLSAYIKACMGDGVSKGDVEDVIEKTLLADKFYQQKVDELKGAVTEEDAEKYREDNKSGFYFTKYASYKLKDSDWAEDAKKADSVEAIKKLIVNKLFEAEYDDEYAKIFATGDAKTEAEAETGSETETTETKGTAKDENPEQTKADVLATILHWNGLDEGHDGDDHDEPAFDDSTTKDEYKKAGYNLSTALDTLIKKELDKVTEEGKSYYADPKGSDATDAQKWLFDEGRKGKDHTVITTESKSTDKDGKETTTKTDYWYFVAEDDDVMQIDTEKTRKGYYVQVTDDTDSKISATDKVKRTAAEKLKLFEEAADQEARIKVLTDILGAAEQSSIASSTFSSKEELKDWFFSDDRKEGDFGKVAVKTSSSDKDDDKAITTDYAVLYLGANEENWLISAKEAVASERLQAWYDEMKESCHLTMDYEMPTSAETTVADTTAAASDDATEPATDTDDSTTTESDGTSESVTDTDTESEAA